jgi:hypothetical protein
MIALLQLVGVAAVPLNVTVLDPCVAPKLLPVMVTPEPTRPEVGATLSIFGLTVNVDPLLFWPLTLTTTGPLEAPAGTGTTIVVLVQLVGVALVPLKVTVLVPCVAPKPLPATVTDVPTGPTFGERLLIVGGCTGKGSVSSES